MRVIEGDPSGSEVAASTPLRSGGSDGCRTGSYDRRSRVTPAEERTLTSGALSTWARWGREGFDFLGYTLGPRHLPNGGRWYLGASPSKKSVQRVKLKVGELLVPGNKGTWDEVRSRLNRVLRGWSAYFSYGALASAYEAVDQHVYDRTRHFLRQRHKVQGRGTDQFSREHVYGELAVRCLRRERGRSSPWALR